MMARFKESERKQVKRETRAKLLEAAADAFSAQGYERANVDDISRAAGFAKGTIYNYFESKRDILLALVEEIAASHNTFVTRRVMENDDPAVRLNRFYQSGFEWVIANPARARLLFTTLNGADDDIRQAMFAAYLPMFELVGREILAAGTDGGPFRPVESGRMAGLLMLIYLGAASQQGPDGRAWVPAEMVSELVLDGLRKRDA